MTPVMERLVKAVQEPVPSAEGDKSATSPPAGGQGLSGPATPPTEATGTPAVIEEPQVSAETNQQPELENMDTGDEGGRQGVGSGTGDEGGIGDHNRGAGTGKGGGLLGVKRPAEPSSDPEANNSEGPEDSTGQVPFKEVSGGKKNKRSKKGKKDQPKPLSTISTRSLLKPANCCRKFGFSHLCWMRPDNAEKNAHSRQIYVLQAGPWLEMTPLKTFKGRKLAAYRKKHRNERTEPGAERSTSPSFPVPQQLELSDGGGVVKDNDCLDISPEPQEDANLKILSRPMHCSDKGPVAVKQHLNHLEARKTSGLRKTLGSLQEGAGEKAAPIIRIEGVVPGDSTISARRTTESQ
ncbi:hypothetical protein pipiens_000207, partial [Culex pipiens pipiens]